jgi:aldose 1-epimerase
MTKSPIVLSKGLLSVGIDPAAGGSLSRLDLLLGSKRIDILRPARSNPCLIAPALNMSCFPLVPYAGRLRGGRFDFAGRVITYPLNALPERNSSHGDGFTREWDVIDLDRDRAVLRACALADAPIQYDCTQTVTVAENRVDITLMARNIESRPIPLECGFHPYFARRAQARIRAQLPTHTHWDEELMPVSVGANRLQQQFERGMAAAELPVAAEFGGWNGRAEIEWPSDGLTVELQTRPALEHVVVWAPDGEEFFCFEPLSHATDSFNRWRGERSLVPPRNLQPDESFEQAISFVVSRFPATI